MGKYNLDRELLKYQNMKVALNPSLLPLVNKFLKIGFYMKKTPDRMKITKKKIPGYRNAMIEIAIFEPERIEKNAPCLIYFHGGAFFLKAATYHKYLISKYASQTPCKVIFVDYRLSPRYPFPISVEDCYAALNWACIHAEESGIDKSRIALGGDSAGGALAAAVTHMARDRKMCKLCFQMLIYPVTDARQNTESIRKYTDTPLWNAKANEIMWKSYLRDGDYHLRAYASLMEAVSFEKLPGAYIEVSEFDCLRDEGIQYAEALRHGGCHVELNETVGTIHGFELAEKSEITSICVSRRVEALRKAFNLELKHDVLKSEFC
jgi:Esterase/lipase